MWGQRRVEYVWSNWIVAAGITLPSSAFRLTDGEIEISQTVGSVDLLGPASRHRVMSLRRVDKAARWNAKSAQCDFAQIEEH